MSLERLRRLTEHSGLDLRGAFHPLSEDRVPSGADGAPGTIVLLGWAGPRGWSSFAASPEAADGQKHPLDRWSRRIIDAMAAACGAAALYPFDGPPFLPFQRWAQRAEAVFVSPLGVLIHPDWGLWHSYRGALALCERLSLPDPATRDHPCETCVDRPCLSRCPVAAFSPEGYDVHACASHLATPDGATCMSTGCLARHACPVGAEHRYGNDQAGFYMRAFRASRT